MRKFFLLPLVMVSLVSCSKKETPEPVDHAAFVQGRYEVNFFSITGYGNVTLPQNGVTAGLTVRKITPATVNLIFKINNNGKTTEIFDEDFDVKPSANGIDIDLTSGGEKAGYFYKDKVEINAVTDDGQRMIIKGTK